MKISKKWQNLFLAVIVIGLLGVNTLLSADNNLKFAPPVTGLWEISDQQTIDNENIIINGSISILATGELSIIDSTVTFAVNGTFNLDISVAGSLIVENSTLTVSNTLYNFTITAEPESSISISDSVVNYLMFSSEESDLQIEDSVFTSYKQFDIIDSPYISIIGTDFLSGEAIFTSNRASLIDLIGNTIEEKGFEIFNAVNATVEYNDFSSHTDFALYIDNGNNVIVSHNSFTNSLSGLKVEGANAVIFNNTFDDLETAMLLSIAHHSTITENIFTVVSDICIELDNSDNLIIENNQFNDSNKAIYGYRSTVAIDDNIFFNLENGMQLLFADYSLISNNNLTDIAEIGLELSSTRNSAVSNNFFMNITSAVNMEACRTGLIENNNLYSVQSGISVISSREIDILANIVENTITGFYLEQTKDVVLTANGAINAVYGITLWSMTNVILSSNGVFDSTYGISVWFSEYIQLLGNQVNTSDIGIVARNTISLLIKNGDYSSLNYGLQILTCDNVIIFGNTFDQIVLDAIHIKSSDGFKVYYNNFYTVGNYGSIESCVGRFDYDLTNVTVVGNYYEGNTDEEVLIDTVIINLSSINIIDRAPLDRAYVVKPTIEFITRDIDDPDDTMEVTVSTQIFVPSGADITVYLDYSLNDENIWNSIDITASEAPIGSIGAINLYAGTISAQLYDYLVIYRIRVKYTDGTETIELFSENNTYIVLTSQETPIIIYEPEVYTTILNDDDVETDTHTTTFFDDYEYFIQVRIANRTDLEIIDGRRHVNLTWTIFDPADNSSESFTAFMLYNSTTDVYFYEFNTFFDVGIVIDYFILAVDVNGTVHRTVLNYTIAIETTSGAGFDAITLLGIGGTLLIVQAIVVIRRRRKREE
ncbi:MAG: right-handed parallel beta-helix repeat-containing protein [Candidatus Heimdallarchaeaceae archaeon]